MMRSCCQPAVQLFYKEGNNTGCVITTLAVSYVQGATESKKSSKIQQRKWKVMGQHVAHGSMS